MSQRRLTAASDLLRLASLLLLAFLALFPGSWATSGQHPQQHPQQPYLFPGRPFSLKSLTPALLDELDADTLQAKTAK